MPLVFLSPSTQEWNYYYTEGTEEEYMNRLADKMEPYLLASAIKFVRNDPARNVNGAIADSNRGNYDVHLALHTNAGGGNFAGKLRGIDVYYSPYSYESERLATIIANNLQDIYPLPNKSRALPTTSLGEVTKTRAVSVLAEIGYHDNPADEEWLKANLGAIARSLVLSLTDYFGIPYIEPGTVTRGIVTTSGSGLNLRSYPSFEGGVIGSIPQGSSVIIYSQYNGWYVVGYGDLLGYASSDFITRNSG